MVGQLPTSFIKIDYKRNKVGNMKDNMWYQSAEIAEKVGNELSFEVTEGQKEYMESHMNEVDEKLESRFDEAPHTVRFEPFFNGVEDVFICECYFN